MAFMDKNFMLHTPVARHLFEDYAKDLPIIDYHCHLDPSQIAQDVRFSNLTELWLYGDHYKWRAMRSCGVDEKYITGDASDYDKFLAYCRIMPLLIGNPLYHWSHLELRRFFGCDLILNEQNAPAIWEHTAKVLQGDISARSLIERSGVELLCTTDDPADSLEYHRQIAASGFKTRVLPAFRPDKGLNLQKADFVPYIQKLGKANGVEIKTLEDLLRAYRVAMERFAGNGCVLADHGMDDGVVFERYDAYHASLVFEAALSGHKPNEVEAAVYKTYLMRFFGEEYVARKWAMQIHFGVLRNPNRKMFERLGPDSGFDTIHGQNTIHALAQLLGELEEKNALPRTILYSINPSDNAAVEALCGSFCRGDGSGMPTVLQGSAWWFNDHDEGMRAQIRGAASLSALGCSLGMLTDSRSFLSYPRHEYYRRILCDEIGRLVENGDYPNDEEALAELVRRICYRNAKEYLFGETFDETDK